MSKRKQNPLIILIVKIFMFFCGAMYAMDILAGRWKLFILYKLEHQELRFSELKLLIPDITERMLVLQLKEMERDGLISRTVYPQVRPKLNTN